LAWVIGVAALSCSPSTGPQVGGETHWLALCTHDSDCGEEGLQCICGTCTKACEGDDACHGEQCYDSKSPLLLNRCEDWDSSAAPAICLRQCDDDAACKRGQQCLQGACVPDDEIKISDFADVSDDVSWSEPVAIVSLPDTIEGAPPSMLGTWREVDCEPSVPRERELRGCVSLTIERDLEGPVRGRLQMQLESGGVLGPFAPVSDPERGYPTELDFSQYGGIASSTQPDVDYRVLGATVFGNKLAFQWNLHDLWASWCQLQRPYRWEVSDRTLYLCVPQDPAQQATMDRGKVQLCLAPRLDMVCESEPCVCDDSSSQPCILRFCECDSQQCDVRAVTRSAEVQFSSDGETAVLAVDSGADSPAITLRRSGS
jgi:hypothetical protein